MFVLSQIQKLQSIKKITLCARMLKRGLFKHMHTEKAQKMLKHDLKGDYFNINIHGEQLKFPFVWLRDNCQCDQCFHKTAKSRNLDWANFNVDVLPESLEENGNFIKISWDDGHTSTFEFNWLLNRSFEPNRQKYYTDNFYKPPKITWNRDTFEKIFTKHDYGNIINSNKALHDWLFNLSIYGVALIENSPQEETAIDSILNKIGFSKRTHYGETFTVQHVLNTSNVAYLSSNLQMHTDLPYYEYCPGVNILHCLVQTESKGGENMLVDCHYVANYMMQHYPYEYNLLTNTEIEWSDVGTENGNEFYKLHRAPVICLDKQNEVIRINFSIPQRNSHFLCDIDHVKPWYKSHGLFLELCHKFAARFKTKPGQMLAFDNRRLLHGRNAYDDTANNVRKIIGAYVDWDEIYSRWRCLKIKLQEKITSK